jgi:hypothetical protein
MALVKQGVEMLSDFGGVLSIPADNAPGGSVPCPTN